MAQRFGVAEYNQAPAGPCNGYIEAPTIAQEANFTMLIRSHSRKDDDFFFTPLVAVNALDLKACIRRPFLAPTRLFKQIDKQPNLTAVRGNDANVGRG